jgi:predicted  nucleic acid-binding Zn-ribbon protein
MRHIGGFPMTSYIASAGYELLVDFEIPMDDIVASLPYVVPLLTVTVLFFLYQRHLPQDSMKRNAILLLGVLSFGAAMIAVLYSAFGTLLGFGSATTFGHFLQLLTDIFFGSIWSSLLYVAGFITVLSIIGYYLISPPDPDFVALQAEFKSLKDESKTSRDALQKIEAENKRLNEFVSEKEDTLTSLESELEAIKAEVSEREKSIALMEEQLKAGSKAAPAPDKGLLEQISMKDALIESLEAEIADLRLAAEGAIRPTADDSIVPELSSKLKDAQTKWEDLSRRAETASEVSDSVISDLVELISQVEASNQSDASKQTLVWLIEGLGRSMTRVAREIGDSHGEEPKIEMIGAIIMVNEIVDAIKKMVR